MVLAQTPPGLHYIRRTRAFFSKFEKFFVLTRCLRQTGSAVNEINPNPGAVESFVVGQGGTLSAPVYTVSSEGAGPPFVNPFLSGSIAVVNVRPHSF